MCGLLLLFSVRPAEVYSFISSYLLTGVFSLHMIVMIMRLGIYIKDVFMHDIHFKMCHDRIFILVMNLKTREC